MKYLIFIGLALIEQLIVILLSKGIVRLQYEYISIKYETFKFANKGEKFCGLNILIKLFLPIIYILIISGIFYNVGKIELVKNIYLITVFYYIIRWIDITFVLNRKELHDWKFEFILSIIGVLLNLFIYYGFIIKTQQIFISIDELRDGIWIGIITFFFILIRDYIYKYAHTDKTKLKRKKENYILKKYEYYKNKYEDIVYEKNKEIEAIFYGIMIYENYNRPAFYRIFEYIKCTIKGEATLGVMQVKTRIWISNKTSVKKGYKIIKKAYKNEMKTEDVDNYEDKIKKVVSKYNGGESYSEEVLYIISVIKEEIEKDNI